MSRSVHLFPFLTGRDGEEGMHEHGERYVPVPIHVEPDFVLAQVAFALRAREAFLGLPAAAGDVNEVSVPGCAG